MKLRDPGRQRSGDPLHPWSAHYASRLVSDAPARSWPPDIPPMAAVRARPVHTATYEQIDGCYFQPPSFGAVFYAAVDRQYRKLGGGEVVLEFARDKRGREHSQNRL